MLTKVLAMIQIWDDTEKRVGLFVPSDLLLAIEAEGHREYVAGRFQLADGDPAFDVPRGSLTTIRAALLVVEGPLGADVTVNGAASPRQLRPPTDAQDAATNVPRSFMLETCADLTDPVPFSVEHPGGEEEVSGLYVLVGDPAA